ncbi:MAG TPA: tetratricopeptide repeat protein [Candidatus Binatus sp.]|uniref:tetratricopeptide repeat protein n=1 Tax=Candidatus Binatus sp. TaxID=2811406 RepID=UPI002B49BFCF|nr:tetratricopeptide repeat protein [Candidatus Binatus sp.]HKN14055.1 tetratricopeptide repeat protein [Candidatus Binatus sp.]
MPDGTWENSAGRKALGSHLKEILRSYPGNPADTQWEHHGLRTSVLGCPLVICSLDTLPSFSEDVLLDIDTDYLTIPRVSYRTEDVLDPVPWRSPEELTELLRAAALTTDFVTIAYSVEGGYTPLAWKYLGDELATRLRCPDEKDLPDAYQRIRQGIVARLQGDLTQAEKIFRAVGDRLGAAPYFHLAYLMAETGRPDEGRHCYEQVLAMDPSYRTAHAGPGIPLYRAKHDDASRDAFCRGVLLDPADAFPHLGLGWIAARRKRWAEAETEFRAALALRPDLIDAHRGLGQALEKQGRSQEAIEPYQQFLKLALRGHRPVNDAIATDPSAGLMLDSDHGRVHAALARIYERNGDTNRATAGYRIAIAGGYDRIAVRVRLARLYGGQQQWRQAREHALAGLLLIPTAVRRSLYGKFRLPMPTASRRRGSNLKADSHRMVVS